MAHKVAHSGAGTSTPEGRNGWCLIGRRMDAAGVPSRVDRWFLTRVVARGQELGRNGEPRKFTLPDGGWTAHDLRRSASTFMQELGVCPDVVDRALKQRKQSKLEKTSQVAALASDQRRALDLLGQFLRAEFAGAVAASLSA